MKLDLYLQARSCKPNVSSVRQYKVCADIPKKFPLRGRNSRQTVFLGYKKVPYGSRELNVLRRLHCFHPLMDIPQMCPTWVTFAEGCTVFQLSTSERLAVPRYRQWAIGHTRGCGDSGAPWREAEH